MKALKIMVWKNVKTNKWECRIREEEKYDWELAPAFETKEEAIAFASYILQFWGSEFEFEVVEL